MNIKEKSPISGQYLVTLGLATFLAWKYSSDQLLYYINERFFPLTLLAIFFLWCIATIYLLQPGLQGNSSPTRNPAILQQIIGLVTSSLPVISALFSQSALTASLTFSLSVLASFFLFKDRIKLNITNTKSAIALLTLALPIVIGISAPAQPLSSGTLDNRGVSLTATFNGAESPQNFDQIEEERTILDWIKIVNSSDNPDVYMGQPVSVIGFVYHNENLSADQFMLIRFVVTCCTADAQAIGLPVQTDETMDLPDNTWMHIQGNLDNTIYNDNTVPLIIAESIEVIEVPQQPYLYP